ncbi:hypothetical protein SAMN04487866_1102 [Thermoactinomyces sp. DSM 45891]|uniref:hypothetical protein n=1 Tax=Thermoactinomyces sp. DSM 45891 TaxID=1761907 RepID=UPI000917D8A1|nr:hypothetical protein [Thermoactinomyces sp. DSM 45891]SFX50868.1 hypothetical protein SAMN04487866_1102 [Thermoactinomyces sp. DSM 45891]
MITFEITQYFQRRKWRFVACVLVMLVLSFVIGKFDGKVNPVTIWDFVFNSSTHIFTCLLIFPCVFLILIWDLYIGDFGSSYLSFTTLRTKSRTHWYLAKYATLFCVAFVFSIAVAVGYILAGMALGLPFEPVVNTHSSFLVKANAFQILSMMVSFQIVALTAFGALILTISLYSRNLLVSWITGGALTYAGYIVFKKFTSWAFLFPTSHLMFLAHFPNQLVPPIPTLTASISMLCGLAFILVCLVVGWIKVRKVDFAK